MENELRSLCYDFVDWLPIKPIILREGAGQGNKIILQYNGPSGFPRHKDQPVICLLQVLQGPKHAKDEPPLTPNSK